MDIRLKVGFFDHPKTIKLKRRAGVEAVECLLRLWMYAAQYRSKGHFNGMTGEDIELAAHWSGEAGKFIAAACDVGLVDRDGDSFVLHDWAEHNPWAFHSDERSEAARDRAAKRWASRNNAQGNASGNACGINKGNAPSPKPNPIPKPLPNPKPKPTPIVSEGDLARLTEAHLEICGIASQPPVRSYQKWIEKGLTVDDILSYYDMVGGYPAMSRQKVLIQMIDNPHQDARTSQIGAPLELTDER